MARTPQSIDVVKKQFGLMHGVPKMDKPPRKKRSMTIDALREAHPELMEVTPLVVAKRRNAAGVIVPRAMSIEDVRVDVGVVKVKKAKAPLADENEDGVIDEVDAAIEEENAPPPSSKKKKFKHKG